MQTALKEEKAALIASLDEQAKLQVEKAACYARSTVRLETSLSHDHVFFGCVCETIRLMLHLLKFIQELDLLAKLRKCS